ncbi:putative membrane transporter protein PD_1894 [Candidatus Nitrosocosmicus franklandus]|uniref:Probable membrane transporter protein n=1 Tax=Candidatus Nitrosocosmicus franklandianus TaxID=1798806 RepID=A0A484I9D8_9ARCH|nr:putative membrane transporter protein PD_1894 [Candidatus Nitrosocosmicus franklandus]
MIITTEALSFCSPHFLYSLFEMNGLEFESVLLPNLLQGTGFLHLQIAPQELLHYSILTSTIIAIGSLVGLSLGLIGGGGSILAVPLLVYVIGLEPHMAIGTSALVVGINALVNFIDHKKRGHVLLNKSLLFAIPGVVGTIIGSQLGLLTPPSSLLILFALFMIAIATKMLVEKKNTKECLDSQFKKIKPLKNNIQKNQLDIKNDNLVTSKRHKNMKAVIMGFLVGLGAGYFGIGGGFLIVPSLMYLDINIVNSIGTSLLPVSFFGLTTAMSYSFAGQINFLIAMVLVFGGIIGGKVGTALSSRASKILLTRIFSILLITVAIYIIIKTIMIE